MPFRTKHGYSTPAGGFVNTRKHTYTGRGRAPAGTRKVPERSYKDVPTVTTSTGPRGTTTVATGFSSPRAAAVAKSRAKRSRRRVHRIASETNRQQAAAVAMGRRQRSKRMTTKTVMSSRPGRQPVSSRPTEFQGKPTAGKPTLAELRRADSKETLGINKAGAVTTPKVRMASQKLKLAAAIVARTQPSLDGLSPAERAVVPLARKAHRKYPDIPVSVIMAQVKQESGFNAAAVSSAGAQGLSQFIPSTAASYGVKYGTGKHEQQSQITGQAHLLHDDDFSSDPQGALSAYSGGYAAGDYNNPILADAKASYVGLDKPGNPKALRRLSRARRGAEAVGLPIKPGQKGKAPVGPPPRKLVKRVVVAEHAMHEVEGTPYVWGGGHGAFTAAGGLDCSGAVSYVIHKVAPNRVTAPLTSGAMGSVLEPGPGALTVFYNDEHTFLRLINRKGEAEYWGTSVGDSGAGGLTRHPTPSAAYLAQYNVGHVPGMGRKQALQLGADPGSVSGSSAFPGMTLSPSGTTATIDPGAGTAKEKAGFSKSPIKLTGLQRLNQAKRKLRSIGAPLGGKKPKDEAHPVLQEMVEKYGTGGAGVPTEAAERTSKMRAAAEAARR